MLAKRLKPVRPGHFLFELALMLSRERRVSSSAGSVLLAMPRRQSRYATGKVALAGLVSTSVSSLSERSVESHVYHQAENKRQVLCSSP